MLFLKISAKQKNFLMKKALKTMEKIEKHQKELNLLFSFLQKTKQDVSKRSYKDNSKNICKNIV